MKLRVNAGLKRCSKCFRILSELNFFPRKKQISGHTSWQSRCKTCNADDFRAYSRDRRRQKSQGEVPD